MKGLDRKVAVVTGGASGIGKAVAARLVAEGARVVITDIDEAAGQAVAADLGCDFAAHDVTSEEEWTRVVREAARRHGGVHVLVNNAGILGPRDAVTPEDTRLTDWRRLFSVNVEGVFLGCRAVIPAMRQSGTGSIVNISSVAGLMATPYATSYGAGKAAVTQLTRSVAQHCAEAGLNIRCNSVHPGDVFTPLWERQAAESAAVRGVSVDELIAQGAATSPLGGFTGADDVAAAVAFLASDEARRITGSMLIVDGGTVGCDTYKKSPAPITESGG